MRWLWLMLVLGVVLLGACTQYEYQIVAPPQLQTTIGPKGESGLLSYPPLEYRFIHQPDNLLMQIINPTEEPLSFVPQASYAVGPSGETHPVIASSGLVLAPHAHIVLAIPAPPQTYATYVNRPVYYPRGWFYYGGPPGYAGAAYYYDPFYYQPEVYYTHVRTPYSWVWYPGAAKFHLTYQQGTKTFSHDFTVVRAEVK